MVCNACGKTYKYKRGLKRHQKQQCGLIDAYLHNQNNRSPQLLKSVLSKVVGSAKPTVVSGSKIEILEDDEPLQSPNKENAPSTCQTCGKVYKYKKPYLNHLINCVPTGNSSNVKLKQEEEGEEEEEEEEQDKTEQIEENTADQLATAETVDEENQSLKDGQTDDEKQMDDKTIEDELDKLVALKNQLELEAIETDDKVSISEETQNNHTQDASNLDEPTPQESS